MGGVHGAGTAVLCISDLGSEMKFNLPLELEAMDSSELLVGNVYKCRGGGKTSFWIVINIDDRSVQVIGINRDGIITSASSYGRHVFDNSTSVFRAKPLGFCPGIDALEFNIEWRETE